MHFLADTTAARFRQDERGVIAIVFALSIFSVTMITGLAIDYVRASHALTKINSAMDAAALAGAKGLRLQNLSDSEVTSLVDTLVRENLSHGGGKYTRDVNLNIRIDREKSLVEISSDVVIPTVFAQLAGINEFNVPTSATAIFEAKDIEVGLQLDLTGSMAGQKIIDLRAAAKDLVDIMIPDEPTGQKVRIGFAPYSAGVNAGPYAAAVNGGRTNVGTCVYERADMAYQASDVAPVGSALLRAKADISGNVQSCPNAQVVPLTDDKDELKSKVDTYLNPQGTTAGQLGTAWAWYLISPEWAGIWPNSSEPAPYGDGQTIKVAILMTDGEYNTFEGKCDGSNGTSCTPTGTRGKKSNQLAKDTCAAMKAKNVIVYTVAFKLNNAIATETMSTCASSPTKFYRAEDGDELRGAFRAIAEDISTLRLSK